MSEVATRSESGFVGYEYLDILVSRRMEPVYSDGYVNFGWTLIGVASSVERYGAVIMKFKRDRSLRNKVELTRLQRQFQSCIAEIERLERSKVLRASVVAYAVGILGTAFMAGSVLSSVRGVALLGVILAIPAVMGWVAPYLCYLFIRTRKAGDVDPLIDEKYGEIYEVCRRAHSLLAQ